MAHLLYFLGGLFIGAGLMLAWMVWFPWWCDR